MTNGPRGISANQPNCLSWSVIRSDDKVPNSEVAEGRTSKSKEETPIVETGDRTRNIHS